MESSLVGAVLVLQPHELVGGERRGSLGERPHASRAHGSPQKPLQWASRRSSHFEPLFSARNRDRKKLFHAACAREGEGEGEEEEEWVCPNYYIIIVIYL